MTKIIPRKLIQHLEYVPGQTQPTPQEISPISASSQVSLVNIDDILNGTIFYDSSMPVALRQALDHVGTEGIIANLSEFIAAKVIAEKAHDFWKKWHTVHTEENIGIDKKGLFYGRDEPVLIIVNGGGILTPERITQAYNEGLVDGSAKYNGAEFDCLLEGRLPSGITIPIYRIEEVKRGVPNIPHQFGVVMPYKIAQDTKSGLHKKKPFLKNPLVIARATGSLDQLEAFYEKAKDSDGDVGNYHLFKGRDASVSQGRVLFVSRDHDGLDGSDGLVNIGRFVGVGAGGAGAPKGGASA